MSSRPLVLLERRGFSPDARFSRDFVSPPAEEIAAEPEIDPLEQAYERGLLEGQAAAQAEYDQQLADLQQHYAGLGTALAALARDEGDRLRERLRDTVIALCEASTLPFALDTELLARRVERAAGMLLRAQDERRVKLNPEDLELVRDLVPDDLVLEADGSLPRGALRVETGDGGIEDGPETWRQAIAEALGQC